MIVEREHGFSSLVRLNTKEEGFNYSISLIFNDGYLIEKQGMRRGFAIWSITYYFDVLKDYAWDDTTQDVAKET